MIPGQTPAAANEAAAFRVAVGKLETALAKQARGAASDAPAAQAAAAAPPVAETPSIEAPEAAKGNSFDEFMGWFDS